MTEVGKGKGGSAPGSLAMVHKWKLDFIQTTRTEDGESR